MNPTADNNLRTVGKWFNILLKIFVIICVAFPFYWVVSTSLKTYSETIILPPTLFPESIQWKNYAVALKSMPFWTYLKNSIFITLSVVILQYIVVIPAAYGFARTRFRGKGLLFGIVLLGFMIPQQITFVPIYILFSKLNLLKSHVPLIMPFIANAFGIFLLRQFFMQVPEEIVEAARLDNASSLKILLRIMIPMAKPAVISIGLLSFISNWNAYFWPLIMTSRPEYRTLPIGVAMMVDTEGVKVWNQLMAGNMLLILPILVVYLFASKQIRKAFTYSGIK